MKPKICVVGSANIDQVSYVKRAPNDGETLFGEDYQICLLYTSPSPRDRG